MYYLKFIFSHLTAFFGGIITVAIYHHWWINPEQVQWIQTLAGPTADIGYPGDWVLDILFPTLPLLVISATLTVALTIHSLLSKKS